MRFPFSPFFTSFLLTRRFPRAVKNALLNTHLNMSLCYIKLERWKRALETAQVAQKLAGEEYVLFLPSFTTLHLPPSFTASCTHLSTRLTRPLTAERTSRPPSGRRRRRSVWAR